MVWQLHSAQQQAVVNLIGVDSSFVKAALGPALFVLAAGVVLALPMRLSTQPVHIAKVALLATLGVSLAALLCGQSLPRHLVVNGNAPAGATCADTTRALGALQTLLAFAAVATGSVAAGGALSARARGYSGVATTLLVTTACGLPYLGLVAWVIPRMCDYS